MTHGRVVRDGARRSGPLLPADAATKTPGVGGVQEGELDRVDDDVRGAGDGVVDDVDAVGDRVVDGGDDVGGGAARGRRPAAATATL